MVQLSTINSYTLILVFILFILCNNNTRGDPLRGPRSNSHRGSSNSPQQSQHRKITNRRQEIERQDRINEWIRTIREAPKGHSMSPSWTSKSNRPQVISVSNLPLQNEAVRVQPKYQQQNQHSSNRDFHDKQLSTVPNFNSIISKHKFNSAAGGGGPLRQKRYPGKKNSKKDMFFSCKILSSHLL